MLVDLVDRQRGQWRIFVAEKRTHICGMHERNPQPSWFALQP